MTSRNIEGKHLFLFLPITDMLIKYVRYVPILDTINRYKTVKQTKKKAKSLATGDLHWSQKNKSTNKNQNISESNKCYAKK